MSVQSEITRLLTARNKLREKGESLGVNLPTDNLSEIATKFDGIVNRGAVQAEVTEGQSYAIPAGYHNGSGTVTGVSGGGDYTLQQKSITPTKTEQSITPDSGYFGLSSVTVHPIPAAYQDVSGVTATAVDVLSTKLLVLPNGTLTAGTMPNNGAVSGSIDGLSSMSYVIPAGYHSGAGSVTLSNDIETALAEI